MSLAMKHFKCDLKPLFGVTERIQTRATPQAREVECVRTEWGLSRAASSCSPHCVVDVPFSGSAGARCGGQLLYILGQTAHTNTPRSFKSV